MPKEKEEKKHSHRHKTKERSDEAKQAPPPPTDLGLNLSPSKSAMDGLISTPVAEFKPTKMTEINLSSTSVSDFKPIKMTITATTPVSVSEFKPTKMEEEDDGFTLRDLLHEEKKKSKTDEDLPLQKHVKREQEIGYPTSIRIEPDVTMRDAQEEDGAKRLKMFITMDFDTQHPSNPSAFAVAIDEGHAYSLLDQELVAQRRKTSTHYPYSIHEIPMYDAGAWIVSMGEMPELGVSAMLTESDHGDNNNKRLRIFVTTNCDTQYPCNPLAFAVASDEGHAYSLLDRKLEAKKRKTSMQHNYSIREISMLEPHASIISMGEMPDLQTISS